MAAIVTRTFTGESLKELARGTGLSPTYLSRVRNGLRTPSLESAGRIAAYMGMSMDDLLAELAERKNNPPNRMPKGKW